MIGQLTTVVFSAVISGAVSRFVTVAALKVHIGYLREAVKDHGQRPRLKRPLLWLMSKGK